MPAFSRFIVRKRGSTIVYAQNSTLHWSTLHFYARWTGSDHLPPPPEFLHSRSFLDTHMWDNPFQRQLSYRRMGWFCACAKRASSAGCCRTAFGWSIQLACDLHTWRLQSPTFSLGPLWASAACCRPSGTMELWRSIDQWSHLCGNSDMDLSYWGAAAHCCGLVPSAARRLGCLQVPDAK